MFNLQKLPVTAALVGALIGASVAHAETRVTYKSVSYTHLTLPTTPYV